MPDEGREPEIAPGTSPLDEALREIRQSQLRESPCDMAAELPEGDA
jgi:hypothetical protein